MLQNIQLKYVYENYTYIETVVEKISAHNLFEKRREGAAFCVSLGRDS